MFLLYRTKASFLTPSHQVMGLTLTGCCQYALPMNFILPQEKVIFSLENLSSVFFIFLGGWVVTLFFSLSHERGGAFLQLASA
jgi:hypothetical protein